MNSTFLVDDALVRIVVHPYRSHVVERSSWVDRRKAMFRKQVTDPSQTRGSYFTRENSNGFLHTHRVVFAQASVEYDPSLTEGVTLVPESDPTLRVGALLGDVVQAHVRQNDLGCSTPHWLQPCVTDSMKLSPDGLHLAVNRREQAGNSEGAQRVD